MELNIRLAQREDCADILKLIKELAVFERAPNEVILTEADIERDGFSEKPLFQCLVALVDEVAVGIALFYWRYSTWKGPTLHLEDLIVNESYTSKGIGSELYKEFVRYAYHQNVQRIEWAVLDWNKKAIDFYRKSGAEVLDDWRIVQMNKPQMRDYLKILSK